MGCCNLSFSMLIDCTIFFILCDDALGIYMDRFLGFCFCVGLLAHGKSVEDILYDICMVGVSLGFDGLGWMVFL